MGGRLVILCPGQGFQSAQMFDLARGDPAARQLLELWFNDNQLAGQLADTLDEDARFTNRVAQPTIVAATLAMWTALAPMLPAPALVAGYSIGELSAYGVAGALDPTEAVRLAMARARLMDACLAAGAPQAMVALSGLPLAALDALLAPHGFHGAIVTGDDSVVAGGPAARQPQLLEAVQAAGGKGTLLRVAVASHTPLMQGAVAPFAALLGDARWRKPDFPVLSGISAEAVVEPAQAITQLPRQIAEPILWRECMDALAESGATVALELGPGAALARMLQARHPQIACRSVSEFRSLDGIYSWLDRQLD